MTEQPTLWPPVSRNTDPDTSKAGERHIAHKRPTQAQQLLRTYQHTDRTDEEAARAAALLDTGYWKRCSDLRNLGLIEPTGHTRPSVAGVEQRVCTITADGWEVLRTGLWPTTPQPTPRKEVTRDDIAAEVHAWMKSPHEHEEHLIDRITSIINRAQKGPQQ